MSSRVFTFGKSRGAGEFSFRHAAPAPTRAPTTTGQRPWEEAPEDDDSGRRRNNSASQKKLFRPEPAAAKSSEDFISFNDLLVDEGGEEPKGDPVSSREASSIEMPTPLWVADPKKYSTDPPTMFKSEVEDFVRYIAPMEAEHSVRLFTVQRLRRVVRTLWPDAEVKVFGSFETLLYLPTSDIDIVILEPSISPRDSLQVLAHALRTADICDSCETVNSARVPLVKYTDSLTRFPVDVSFNMQNGPMAAEMVKELLKDQRLGNGIRGLMYLMKQFLAQRNLNEVFSGGLGSYGLLLFVTAFLKLHPLVQTGEIIPEENVGVLFIELLEFSNKFDYDAVGINFSSDMDVSYFSKEKLSNKARTGVLTIIDPQDPNNIVTAGSFAFWKVKSEMFRAYTVLVASIASHYSKRHAYEDDLTYYRHRRERGVLRDGEEKPKPPPRPTTILGTIISVRKDLFLVRSYREELAEGLKDGTVNDDNGDWEEAVRDLHMVAPVVIGKRKRGSEDAERGVRGEHKKRERDWKKSKADASRDNDRRRSTGDIERRRDVDEDRRNSSRSHGGGGRLWEENDSRHDRDTPRRENDRRRESPRRRESHRRRDDHNEQPRGSVRQRYDLYDQDTSRGSMRYDIYGASSRDEGLSEGARYNESAAINVREEVQRTVKRRRVDDEGHYSSDRREINDEERLFDHTNSRVVRSGGFL